MVLGNVVRFCCQGCMAVFQILSNRPGGPSKDFLDSDLYRACVDSGIISGNEQTFARESEAGTETGHGLSALRDEQGNLAQEMTIKIEGMWCSACAWVIEALLRRMPGVLEARVLFFSDVAAVRVLPHLAPPRDILKAIERLGYGATLLEDQAEASKEKKRLLLRLGLSCILTMNIMMISFALYSGFFHELNEDAVRYFAYPLWFLATPIVFYSGFSILERAWAGLRLRRFSMDTLIAIGALSAYFYSVAMMIESSLHLYFDTAAMLVTLVLVGKYIEQEAKAQATRGITGLYGLSTGKVRLSGGNREVWILSEDAKPGDEFLVLSDERIPLDAVIVSGSAEVDESILTGESRPLRRSSGDEVLGGSLVLSGQLLLRATRPAAESSVSRILSMIHRAIEEKSPVELLADRLTRWLVPIVLLLAAGTVLYVCYEGVAFDQALLRGLTVLVITCPCALAIATPLAKVAAIGVSKANGIIVQNPEGFERAKRLDTIIFDKTGTITEGRFLLREVFAEKVESDEALRRVASLEVHSDHFLAREIVRKARELCLDLAEPCSVEVFSGLGIQGTLEGGKVYAGNRQFMKERGLVLRAAFEERADLRESSGMTVVFFGWNQEAQGFLAFGDMLRTEAKRVVSELRTNGLEIWLISGDSQKTTRAIAQELEIQKYVGPALPGDKVNLVRKLQEEGRQVGVVGDGLNDTPALAQASLGVAFGGTPNSVANACDITLLSNHLGRIPDLLQLSVLTTKVIRENLGFAFLYNIVGIPLAVAGVLNPLMAVLAMLASSLTVIGNTLRISKSQSCKQRPANP